MLLALHVDWMANESITGMMSNESYLASFLCNTSSTSKSCISKFVLHLLIQGNLVDFNNIWVDYFVYFGIVKTRFCVDEFSMRLGKIIFNRPVKTYIKQKKGQYKICA